MYDALKAFHKKYPHLHTDLWIDDLSFDVVHRDPAQATRIALQAYEYIRQLLEADNLKISAHKTGFIASNSEAKRLLQQQLPKDGPRVHDVMRDLGVDCTAGRLRRIQTLKGRRIKASRKTKKLATLKIPLRSIRLKLYKGSIVAGISWGHEAMGLAPQVRRRLKAVMGRQIGLQRTGTLTSSSTCTASIRIQTMALSCLGSASTGVSMETGRRLHKKLWNDPGLPSERDSFKLNIHGKWPKAQWLL